jgi:precorrin-6B methylase 2
MAKRALVAAAFVVLAPAMAAALSDEPARYSGREPFVAMDADAPPQSALRAGPLADVQWYDLAINAAGAQQGQTVADIGFGAGRITIELAEAVGPSGRVFARDISDEGLSTLQWRMDQAGISNIEAVISRPDDVLVDPGQVDVALLADVYSIIVRRQGESRGPFLKSLFAAMKPGGVVVIVNVTTGAAWADPEQKFHRAIVRDFTGHGFTAGRRLVFGDGGGFLREILEFQRPEE